MKNIVIIGGGFAGIKLAGDLAGMKTGAAVTVVDPKEYMEVPFGQLRAMVDPEGFGPLIRRNYSDFLDGVRTVKDKARKLENGRVHLESGDSLEYDFLVLATGSSFPAWSYLKGEQPDLADRHKATSDEYDRLAGAQSILIVGGGVIGVETAGEIAHRWPEKKVRILEGGPRILGSLREKMTARAEKILGGMGVEITTGTRYTEGMEKDYDADLVLKAVGISLNTGWISGSLEIPMNDRAAVEVEDSFRVKGLENVFAIGDITDVPELKQGVFASMHAGVVAKNIAALMKNTSAKLKSYKPQKTMALITIGPDAGIVQLPFGHPHFMASLKQKDFLAGRFFKG